MKNIKKVIIGIIIVLISLATSFIIYDRITINNQYYIGEKNLKIPIFVYHDIISDNLEIQYDYMQTKRTTFEKQIEGLKKLGYHFIEYGELVEYKNGERPLYKKSCIITFDDGFEGVYDNAYPIAQKYNIPFTMFIITDNMEKEGVINWEQAKEMKESGLVTIASHSMNHPDFTNILLEEAVENVSTSYEIIEEKLGNEEIKIFTYPYGLFTEEQIQEFEKLGYVQNLTDNKINTSNNLNLSKLHRSYPLDDSIYKMWAKIFYRSVRYN